jgi:hypothetical protein
MKMFLTRIGIGAKAVVTGDVTQIDLQRGQKSGLIEARQILREVRGIAFTEFLKEDVVRHPLVARIVSAYEAHTAALEAREAAPGRAGMAKGEWRLQVSVQRAGDWPDLPGKSQVRTLGTRRVAPSTRWRTDHRAFRRQRRRPAPEPRLPGQRLRHQRPLLSLPAGTPCSAVISCSACRSSRARRPPRTSRSRHITPI